MESVFASCLGRILGRGVCAVFSAVPFANGMPVRISPALLLESWRISEVRVHIYAFAGVGRG